MLFKNQLTGRHSVQLLFLSPGFSLGETKYITQTGLPVYGIRTFNNLDHLLTDHLNRKAVGETVPMPLNSWAEVTSKWTGQAKSPQIIARICISLTLGVLEAPNNCRSDFSHYSFVDSAEDLHRRASCPTVSCDGASEFAASTLQ